MFEKSNDKNFKVAIYIRISKEDADKGLNESESITNQKTLLTKYVDSLGKQYELIDMYIDPGYTGTNFNRPEFKRMIKDITLGKVNMVVTKDLSRLGRDYIETGEYIEKWFPENRVRYVSVNDAIDTFNANNSNNDVAPFKAILNDMYSKDLSRKIKSAFHTMQQQGKWLGGTPAYGYKRDPDNRNRLIIDENEAEIVRIIFNMALVGNRVGIIKNYLNEHNIPTFSKIHRNNLTSFWENKTVKQILSNPVYIGMTVQNKRSRISYKNRKLRINPEEQWYVVENTHEPIIDKEIYDAVQKMVITQRYDRNEKKNNFLLDGLLFCYECKHKIGIRSMKNGYKNTVCNYYRRNSKLNLCTSHGYNYDKLEKTILDVIRKLFLDIDSKKIELNIKNSSNEFDYQKQIKKLGNEINLIDNNIDKMYIDKLNNKINADMYERILKKLEDVRNNKKEKYDEILEMQNKEKSESNRELEKIIKKFLALDNPTPELMRVIINRIELHQNRQVDIIFNFKKLNYFLGQNVHI